MTSKKYYSAVSSNQSDASASTGTKTVSLTGESQDQTQTVTIPDGATVTGVTTDNGKVSYTVSDNQVTVSVSGGNPSQGTKYSPAAKSKNVKDTIGPQSTDSFPATKSYSDGTYSGTLKYIDSSSVAKSKTATGTIQADSYQSLPPSKEYKDDYGYAGMLTLTGYTSGSSSKSKAVTDTIGPQRSLDFPATKSYNDGTYFGTLSYTGYSNCKIYDSKTVTSTSGPQSSNNFPSTLTYNDGTYSAIIPYVGYTTSTSYNTKTVTDTVGPQSSNSFPATKSYNDGTYSGSLNYTGCTSQTTTQFDPNDTKYVTQSTGQYAYNSGYPQEISYYDGSYSGTLNFIGATSSGHCNYGGTVERFNVVTMYTGNYSGTVSEPVTTYTGNYSGTVYGQVDAYTGNYSGLVFAPTTIYTGNYSGTVYSKESVYTGNYSGTVYAPGNVTYSYYPYSVTISYVGTSSDATEIYTPNPIGNYTQSVTDITISSPGIPVAFTRTYNSADNNIGPFGRGWSFSYYGRIKDSKYTYTDSNGTAQTIDTKVVDLPNCSSDTYQLKDGQYYSCETRNKLVKNADGSFTVTTQGRLVYGFNSSGYLYSIADKNRNTVNINVDSDGKILNVTDTAGRNYGISYNLSGLISSIADPIERTVNYDYSNGNLSAVTSPEKIVTARYSYDSSNYLTQICDALNNVLQSVAYAHDSGANNGMVTSVTDSYGISSTYSYNSADNSITFTDKNNKKSVTWYDANNNVIKTQDTDGKVVSYAYADSYCDFGSTTDSSGTTSYQYDSDGNVTSIVNPDGSTETRTYDSNGNMLSEIPSDGSATYYEYDSNGNCKLMAEPKNGKDIYSDTADQSLFNITKYSYFSNGLISSENDPDNTVTSYTYNSNGDVLKKTVEIGTVKNTYSYGYNTIGWITSKVTPSNNTTTFVYNSDGKTVKITDNKGTTRYVYDAAGRLAQQISPSEYDSSKDGLNSYPSVNSYSNGNVGYRYTYSGTNIAKVTLPNNEELTYNCDGNIDTFHNTAAGADAGLLIYTYTGGKIETISKDGTEMVRYFYDNDQLAREDNRYQCETTAYSYDGNGNIVTRTTYPYTTYDNISSATPIHTYEYSYGNSSDPNQLTDYDRKYITYDTSGNMLTFNGWSFAWSGKNLSEASKSSDSISYNYSYNDDGIRTSKTVNGVTTSFTLDEDGNITEQTDGTNTIDFTYDSNGRLQFMTLNGSKYIYETNAQGDVSGLLDSNGKEVITYTYDAWGNMISSDGSLKDTVGKLNPFRYRGYYYDAETGMYYLQSRYYNPEIGRFISRDDQSYHDGMTGAAANLYAYANNNPVMNTDPDGHFYLSAFWSGLLIDTLLLAFAPGIAAFFDGFGITLRAMSYKCGFKYAEKLLKLQMVKCTQFGIFNSLATAIRSIIFKLTGAAANNISGSLIALCISNMASSIKFLSIFFSAGSFITGVLDKISDGKLDDKITFPFNFSWIYKSSMWLA